jgi:hypothetical protein
LWRNYKWFWQTIRFEPGDKVFNGH